VLAAGGVFLPVAALTVGSLGLLPTQSAARAVDPAMSDQTATAAYGASGILPQSPELSAALLADIVQAREPGADPVVAVPPGGLTIPPAALTAYQRAESALALQQPHCKVSWTLLAGLGRVISDHGSGSLDPSGNSTRPILGPQLNGSPGLANIRDTDGGRLDNDTEWDRAAGPMQIIPTVWRRVGGDSDGDGYGSPHNIFDSALAAGRYLCEGDVDLTDVTEQAKAVFRYQRSDLFVRAVMAWAQAYGPRLLPTLPSGPVLPPVEKIPPPAKTPPPPGALPRGVPQAPASVLPPPSPPPPPPRNTGSPPGPPAPPPGPTPPTTPPGTTTPTTTVPTRPSTTTAPTTTTNPAPTGPTTTTAPTTTINPTTTTNPTPTGPIPTGPTPTNPTPTTGPIPTGPTERPPRGR
jgi:hypothetical protein